MRAQISGNARYLINLWNKLGINYIEMDKAALVEGKGSICEKEPLQKAGRSIVWNIGCN